MSFGSTPETRAARIGGTEEAGVEEMLTVKYRCAGNETLVEAFRVSQHHEGELPVVTASLTENPDSETMTFGPAQTGVQGSDVPTVFVMNRFGATVATYRL